MWSPLLASVLPPTEYIFKIGFYAVIKAIFVLILGDVSIQCSSLNLFRTIEQCAWFKNNNFITMSNRKFIVILFQGLAVVTFIVSINSLLLVSFDRFLRIARHVDYDRLLTRRRIILLIAIAWLLSIGMFLVLPLLGLWSCASQHCCADDGEIDAIVKCLK